MSQPKCHKLYNYERFNINNMTKTNKDIALSLLKKYNTPPHVVKHCIEVSRVSVILGKELNKIGMCLSIELIEIASLLHDISRIHENHEEVGGKIVEDEGFFDEAIIIKKHMHYEITRDIYSIKEIDVVCLGDRMVKEDKYVGLEKRMEYILKKWEGNKEAQKYIKKKVKQQKYLLLEIEKMINKEIDDLINTKEVD